MEITGKSGRKIIPGEVIQSAFDLDSTLFDISVKGNNLIITGYGFGHGLGLSQWGAEAMAEKKRQDELVERQRKIRQLKATGIQEKHLLEWNFGVAEDNKDIQMAKRYVEQWKKVKAENLGLCYGEMSEQESPLWLHVLPMRCCNRAFRF